MGSHHNVSVDYDKLLKVFAKNLRRTMDAKPPLDDPVELSKKTKGEVAKTSIYRYLKAESNLTMKHLAELSVALDVQPWELLVDPDRPIDDIVRRLLGR